jgi:hypothetical protein|nr:MAG TPA: hypothetical protein [Caudoviricetes sp.]
MFKCELLIRDKRYDVTDDLKNWNDFELSHKRPNYDGVVRSYSTSFEFVNNAFILLKKEYRSRYMEASATVIFSLRNNNWEYDEVFRCALDFSTYSEDGYVVSINAIDNTLAAIIKAKKSIQYEYPIKYIKNKRELYYDSLSMNYSKPYVLGGNTVENDASLQYVTVDAATYTEAERYSLPLYTLDGELPGRDSPLVFQDVPFESKEDIAVFVRALFDIDITLKFSFDFYVGSGHDYLKNAGVILGGRYEDGRLVELKRWMCDANSTDPTHVSENLKIRLYKGQGLFIVLELWYSNINAHSTTVFFRDFQLKTEFIARASPVNIDIVSPVTVLNNLLNSMSEGNAEYKGYFNYDIADGSRNLKLERTYIMAAESARGLPEAKIYTSYKKFCEWMEAEFGYVPVISGNEVTFTHRDNLFANTVVNELGMEINDYELAVNDSLIYSSVKVGYDKQDYDSVNGRDEFRFTNEFSTGLKLTDNTLSLISPYRADAYGIEFLVQKRGEDTTDNDSDNDVFFVECDNSVPVDQPLLLYRPYSAAQLSGLLSPDTMFNLNYSPRFMLEANKKYIGACTGILKFASSNGNSDVSIDGVGETDDLLIPERLFTVGEVNIKTSDLDVPSDLTGLVRFTNQGETITGYIKNLSLNIAKEKGSTYTLIVKDIKS